MTFRVLCSGGFLLEILDELIDDENAKPRRRVALCRKKRRIRSENLLMTGSSIKLCFFYFESQVPFSTLRRRRLVELINIHLHKLTVMFVVEVVVNKA